MDAKAKIDVVRIPHDGLPMEIVTVPLMYAGDFEHTNNRAKHSEEYLEYVPFLSEYKDWYSYSNEYRELVNLGKLDPGQSKRERFQNPGPYFIYKFSRRAEKVLNGEKNKHFQNVEGAIGVHGNAFIFKVKRPGSKDEDRVVEYEKLDKSFIDYVFKGKEGKFLSASECLRWMSKL